jgi:hypothetical protein
MARTTTSFALAALLASAPLAAAAAPVGSPDRPAAAESVRFEHAAAPPVTGAVPNVDSAAPTTPVPMNLPDDATANEVQGQYAIGIVSLVIGALVLAALVVGGLYILARRSWTTSHPTH